MWIATEFRAPMRRLVGVVYFHFKSNLPSLINDFDEGSDSVLGDGERKERERRTRFIWSWAGGERELSFSPGWGLKGGWV